MSDDGTDQAGAGPTDAAIENATPIGGATSQSGSVQATPEVQNAPVGGWKFAFGGKEYTKPEDLAKDHQELHKGFTQATQKYSKEVEAYRAISDWLSNLKKDPARWTRFAQFVEGKEATQQAAQTPNQQTAVLPDQTTERMTTFQSEIEGRLEVQATELEYLKFTQSHPELTKDQTDRVVDRLLKWEDGGKKGRTFEEAYRYELGEENAAEFFKAGQKSAETAVAKGKAASQVLGAVPATTQGAKAAPRYRDLKTPGEQMEWISKKAKELGYKPPK